MQFTRVPWSGPDIKTFPAAPLLQWQRPRVAPLPAAPYVGAQGLLCACWLRAGEARPWWSLVDCESPGEGEVGHGFGGDLVRPLARSRAGFEARLCKGLWMAVIYLRLVLLASSDGRRYQECREQWMSWTARWGCLAW